MKIEIEWIEDYTDCELCGSSSADGANVKIDGIDWDLDMEPVAACYDGRSFNEWDVYAAIFALAGMEFTAGDTEDYKARLEAAGHEVDETHTYPDYEAMDYSYEDDDE